MKPRRRTRRIVWVPSSIGIGIGVVGVAVTLSPPSTWAGASCGRSSDWALRVFDAAVDLDGVAPESRVFVDTPNHEHLAQLPELFRDAARSLDSA